MSYNDFAKMHTGHRIVISHHKLVMNKDFRKYPFAIVDLESEENRVAKRIGIYDPKSKKIKWVDILVKE